MESWAFLVHIGARWVFYGLPHWAATHCKSSLEEKHARQHTGSQRTKACSHVYCIQTSLQTTFSSTVYMCVYIYTPPPLQNRAHSNDMVWSSFQWYEDGWGYFFYVSSTFNLLGHSLIGIMVRSLVSKELLIFSTPTDYLFIIVA